MTHISNALRCRVNIWCQAHLCGFFECNVLVKFNVGSPETHNIMIKCLLILRCHFFFNFDLITFLVILFSLTHIISPSISKYLVLVPLLDF